MVVIPGVLAFTEGYHGSQLSHWVRALCGMIRGDRLLATDVTYEVELALEIEKFEVLLTAARVFRLCAKYALSGM